MSLINQLILIILSFAVFFQLISVALPYWWTNPLGHSGLWETCVNGKCSTNKYKPAEHFKALQSLQLLGLVAGILAIATIFIGKLTRILRPGQIKVITAVHCIAAGTLILLGIVVWSIREFSLSACYVMSLLSAFVCGIIGGRLTVPEEQ